MSTHLLGKNSYTAPEALALAGLGIINLMGVFGALFVLSSHWLPGGGYPMNQSSAETAVRALLVSNDPPTIEQLSRSLKELAASTEVCRDISNATRLLNTRKFETVVVDLKLGEETRELLERVRLSPSQSHHSGISRSPKIKL